MKQDKIVLEDHYSDEVRTNTNKEEKKRAAVLSTTNSTNSQSKKEPIKGQLVIKSLL